MPKPSDFFVGITELFAILVPGFVVVVGIGPLLGADVPGTASNAWSWVVVLIGSYLVGSVFYAIGARLDRVYDWHRWPDKKARTDSDEAGRLLAAVKALRRGGAHPDVGELVNNYKWSRSVLQSYRPASWAEVCRTEADSKLFRSLVIPLIIFAVLSLLQQQDMNHVLQAVVALLMAIVAFIRYWKLRAKACSAAYEHALVFATTQGAYGKPASGG